MVEGPIARYLAEFVGTYLLVFTVGCNVLTSSVSAVWAPTSIAAVLMVMIYALGPSSGANFNPAVSLALGISKKLPLMDVAIYCVVQVLAGVLAGFSYCLMLQGKLDLGPSKGFGWLEVGLVEMLYTFMLCFVVLNSAASTKNNPPDNGNQFFGLAIGFVIIAGGYAGGPISGGAFNPAVALGIDVSSFSLYWSGIYIAFEIVGAALAAILFRVIRFEDYGSGGPPGLGIRCLAELLGTYFLVLTVGLNVLADSPAPAWSIAAALMCMIFSLGNVSGAHFNPAVTLAVLLSGRRAIPGFLDAVLYIVSQVVGGTAAAMTYVFVHHGRSFPCAPKEPFGWARAMAVEMCFTFVLCLVVLSVATVQRPLSQYFALAIGSCVTAGGFASGSISGGSLNPAVSIGIAAGELWNGGPFYNAFIYSMAEFVGAGLAVGVFMVTHPSEYSKGAWQQVLFSAPIEVW